MGSNLAESSNAAQRHALIMTAYKKKDWTTFKKLVQEAHEEKIKRHGVPGDWEAAKADVDKMTFPNEVGAEKSRTSHSIDKNTSHQLINYELSLPYIRGYELIGAYSFCPECKRILSERFLLFNNQLNTVYQKEFIKHGDIVNS
ncbi:MAG: hypothetical protein ACOX50_04170 [Patescibacteria group bacterium]